jgi:hypothetical protein
MTSFSLLRISLVAIWFEMMYFVFPNVFYEMSDNVFGTDSGFRASALAGLAQKLFERREKRGLTYLDVALRILHKNPPDSVYRLKDYDKLNVTINLCYHHQHETAIPFEYFTSLAFAMTEMSYKKISEETRRILSLEQVLWTHMYETVKGSRLLLFRVSLYFVPVLAVLISLLTEKMREAVWKFVETAGAQGWGEIVLASVTYFAVLYTSRPGLMAFSNRISRKYLNEMEQVWELSNQKPKSSTIWQAEVRTRQ